MVDYHDADWPAQILAEGGPGSGTDLVGASGKAALACAGPVAGCDRPHHHGPADRRGRAALGLEVLGMLVHPDHKQLTQMPMLLRQGRCRSRPGEFPWRKAPWHTGAIEGGERCCACPPPTASLDERHGGAGLGWVLLSAHLATLLPGSSEVLLGPWRPGSGSMASLLPGRRSAIPWAP